MHDLAVLTDAGRAFQTRKAAIGNARSPSAVRRVVSMSNVNVDLERRRRRDSTSPKLVRKNICTRQTWSSQDLSLGLETCFYKSWSQSWS